MAAIVIGLIARHARDAQAFYIVLALTFAGIAHAPIMAHSLNNLLIIYLGD